MGVFDKLKNALFEVEYVEVEEKPKKEKTIKPREKSRDDEDKPIAKKIVLPGKREEKVEKIQEEEMKDDNFEIRPKNETIKEVPGPVFKFMDDEDFAVDDNHLGESLPSNSVVPNVEEDPAMMRRPVRDERRPAPVTNSSYDRTMQSAPIPNESYDRTASSVPDVPYEREEYPAKVEVPKMIYDTAKDRGTKQPYGVDTTTFEAAKDYGSYEKKEEKTYFRPSPIISPIYGILDKNYRKEDVVAKKDIRITTNYTRSNVNVDDIRDKAYGRRSNMVQADEPEPVIIDNPSFEVEEEDDEPLLVDLSDATEKPEVKSITVGDAMEYFDDLGLEYNVDYVDATNKKKSNGLEEDIKYNMDTVVREKPKAVSAPKPVPVPAPAPVVAPQPEIISTVSNDVNKNVNVIEVKEESSDNLVDDDDNLFDLIDSMYKESDE